MPPVRLTVLLLAAAALLSACGGGGGNSAGSGTGSRCVGTALFGCLVANQWGLGRIRTEPAWRRISEINGEVTPPGAGQTVGVIDSGIDQDNPAFCKGSATCQKTITEEFLDGATDETGTQRSHGTAVASVIVGRLVSAPGVAWGADVAMFAIPLGSGGGAYRPVSLATLARDDDDFKAVIDRVLAWSSGTRTLDFVNLSIGFNGIVDQYSTQDLRSNYGDSIDALAQTGATEKTVFVWGAGNAHGDPCDPADFTGNADLCESYVENGETKYRVNARSVQILPGLPVLIPELRGHIVAVVAIGQNGEIASFSNRCGSAADWCLAAPGRQIRAAYFGPHPDTNEAGARGIYNPSGTSFAAPMVTGALVVMKHYFRDQMSNTALVERMLQTANDQGRYADSAIYGHGLLDLDAATTPVGTSSLALGNTVGGPGSPLVQTRLTLGNALGNGLTTALAGQEVAAFDELGAPFWYKLGGFARAAPGPSGMARLNAFMAWPEGDGNAATAGIGQAPVSGFMPGNRGVGATGLRLGYLGGPSGGMGGGHLALAGRALALSTAGSAGERTEERAGERAGGRAGERPWGPGGLGFTVFSTEGQRGPAPVSGAVLSWRSPERPVGLRAGLIGERESLLGSRAAGAFGRLSAGSAFVGFEGGTRVGAWRLDASAEIGMAHAAAGGGLITGVSPLFSSAFAIRAQRPLAGGDTLHLSVSQPLRLETGRARLSVPVGRTKDGRVLRQPLTADLAPTGRQIEIAAQWHRPLPAAGAVRLGATWTIHPGHDAAAPSDLTLLAGWRHKF